MAPPTAAIVIVGDEVLSGHTQDTNSHWLAGRLAGHGVGVLRVETIPDDEAEIEATLRRVLAREVPGFVFVVGGLGPTPDDRTYEGVRRALGVPLEVRPEHEAWARRRAEERGVANEPWADPSRSESARRMIRLPRDAQPLPNPVGAALGCVVEVGATRLVVLPGVPREFEAMFENEFEPRYLAGLVASDVTRELVVVGQEASLWDALSEVAGEHTDVKVGSYPQEEGGRIVLRLRGPRASVEQAEERLAGLVGARRIHPLIQLRRLGHGCTGT